MKADGFSLVEVLIATALVVVGAASLAQLFGTSADRIRDARMASLALLLAEQKLEQLRIGPVAASSPSNALRVDTPGYVDYVDAHGVSTSPAIGALYTRRWSIEAIVGGEAVVLQVLVIPSGIHLVTVKTPRVD